MAETLVVGGTGAMGRAVVGRLVRSGHAVRVLTRDPDSSHATRLKEDWGHDVQLVAGTITAVGLDPTVLRGVDRIFCNTTFFSTNSPVGEHDQGMAVLESSRRADVDRFVWSSLDSAASLTGGALPVPHWDSKAAVAARINLLRSEEMMRGVDDGWYAEHVGILTTAPYYENLQLRLAPSTEVGSDGAVRHVFRLPLGATGRYPMIGLEDIAWFAEHLLDGHRPAGRRDLAVIGDALTGDEIAATFQRVTGRAARYEPVSLDVVRSIPDVGHDYAAMFAFFAHHDLLGRDRDLSSLRSIHPGVSTFDAWLERTGWAGEERETHAYSTRLPHGPPSVQRATDRP